MNRWDRATQGAPLAPVTCSGCSSCRSGSGLQPSPPRLPYGLRQARSPRVQCGIHRAAQAAQSQLVLHLCAG
eukprot:scaffold5016_cov118-Isochrysis_galbana.AAC.5